MWECSEKGSSEGKEGSRPADGTVLTRSESGLIAECQADGILLHEGWRPHTFYYRYRYRERSQTVAAFVRIIKTVFPQLMV